MSVLRGVELLAEDLRGGGTGATGDTLEDEGGMGTGGTLPSGYWDWGVSMLGQVFEGSVRGSEAYGGGIETP